MVRIYDDNTFFFHRKNYTCDFSICVTCYLYIVNLRKPYPTTIVKILFISIFCI